MYKVTSLMNHLGIEMNVQDCIDNFTQKKIIRSTKHRHDRHEILVITLHYHVQVRQHLICERLLRLFTASEVTPGLAQEAQSFAALVALNVWVHCRMGGVGYRAATKSSFPSTRGLVIGTFHPRRAATPTWYEQRGRCVGR